MPCNTRHDARPCSSPDVMCGIIWAGIPEGCDGRSLVGPLRGMIFFLDAMQQRLCSACSSSTICSSVFVAFPFKVVRAVRMGYDMMRETKETISMVSVANFSSDPLSMGSDRTLPSNPSGGGWDNGEREALDACSAAVSVVYMMRHTPTPTNPCHQLHTYMHTYEVLVGARRRDSLVLSRW